MATNTKTWAQVNTLHVAWRFKLTPPSIWPRQYDNYWNIYLEQNSQNPTDKILINKGIEKKIFLNKK